MASKETGKAGDVRIYLISCMLFFCIVAGGAFLALYIHLPESETAAWYPAAGMILVGIPWIFWLLTLIYTCLKKIITGSINNNNNNNNMNNNNNNKIAPVITNVARTSGATSAGRTSASADSPGGGGGGAGHVRFGAATVMGEEDDHDDGMGSHSSDTQLPDHLDHDDGEGEPSHIRNAAGSSNNSGDGSSSLGSHESEIPLAFSMSS
ncbi:hypothetical protein BVC80_1833g74 [Macleaya cordata]|uniref:Uncharacterized protein n=1 Tax=Macleaya cordata TaxID=56857 RepID=A0A200R6U3_MACCD|nr:hypothetical protein BVC80_1833g74 [Macleaya cordata]